MKEVLGRVLPAGARERVFSVELIKKRWAEAVGSELARRSEPEALSQGVLTVRVIDPVWGKMIYRLQGQIIPKLNRAVGSTLVRRINFTKRSRLAGVASRAHQPVEHREPPEPPPGVVEAAGGIEEPELKELVLRSAANYLQARERRRK